MKDRIEQVISKALKNVDNDRYILSLMVAKRSKEILSGADIKVQGMNLSTDKASDIALLEIAEGFIKFKGFMDKNIAE